MIFVDIVKGNFVFASMRIAVQNVAHHDRTAMGDIWDRVGQTPEHRSISWTSEFLSIQGC